MPRIAVKTRFSSSFLPIRLRQAATLFALASTSTTAPFASSFNVLAATSFSQQHTSVFGVLRRTSSSLSKGSTMSLSSTTTEEEETMESKVADDLMTPASKLDALRAKMKEIDLDVYIVPSDDPHLSEYVPDAYMRRKFLSGFGGSAGTAVVTQSSALLWTDSRYWNEANLQLDGSLWTLMKQGQPDVPSIVKYLGEEAVKQYKTNDGDKKTLRVGIDPFVHSASFAKEFSDAVKEAAKTEFDDESLVIGKLDTSNANLIDPIWGESRPQVPFNPFRVHPLEYAGISLAEKVEKVRDQMKEKKATMAVFGALDDVAYLFNVRSMGDVDTCPVGIAYATITNDQIILYCDSRKVQSPETKEHLAEVTIKGYDEIVDVIKEHANIEGNKVWIDTSRSNLALASVIPEKALVDSQNAITPMKARKNSAELEGMRKAHVVDGAAMAKFMAWLEEEVAVQGKRVSEVEIDEVLTSCRAEQPGFLECSFPTIAGVGSNAAIIHYRAKPGELMKYLDTSEGILIDSGGQYEYGTTDVTRTWHFGEATHEFKETYTRVLKGNIGVDSMIFPENTPGFVLDVMARKSLWEAGKDYGHGTGHGVGAALNVHEGPFSISPRFANKEGLKQGMVVSNEPGFYEDGSFGIRIENLLEMQYVDPEHDKSTNSEEKTTDKKFLKFAKLTMIPIQKNLIVTSLMSTKELDWLDAYHEDVFAKVSPLLKENSAAMKWLKKSCEKIDRTS
ncbi:peptidase M24 family protein [Nitzschia inconspicua]|uniref:Peptidase M24 family protein n=1 Tax=Nitzschia inconspicua TaxID=303405 RepID=A0A9K3LPC7_9STRA|nr:peptidase M24 family protein [Nitzschia inconspicua]